MKQEGSTVKLLRCWITDDGFYMALVLGPGPLCLPTVSIVTGASVAQLKSNLADYEELELLEVTDDTTEETILEFSHYCVGYGAVWLLQRTKRFKRILSAFGAEEIEVPVLA